MKLTNFLNNQGYDLIEGPVRNQKPLQLWLKKSFSEIELYYDHINHAFKSEVVLNEIENQALSINSNQKNDYEFNIGITLLEGILQSLGLGALELSSKIASGKSVSISYDNSITKEYALGNLEEYFFSADFMHANPSLLKNANQNNIFIITGTVFAKSILVDIETNLSLDTNLVTTLTDKADGKLDFSLKNNNVLKMLSNGNSYFPIAVKASRVDFDRSVFKKLSLMTDSRNIF